MLPRVALCLENLRPRTATAFAWRKIRYVTAGLKKRRYVK
jgi:hypothetical protein